MAAGKLHFQSDAGGVTTVSREAGATNGELVLPASGTVASVSSAVTDNAIARYDSTTGKLQNSGVIIDDNDNVGIGVPPSAWMTTAENRQTLQIKNGAISATPADIAINNNYYRDSSYVNRYLSNGYASFYGQGSDGGHRWYVAPSGTAGQPLTWYNAMTLDSAGNVGVGTTPSAWNSIYKSIGIGSGASFTGTNITTYAGMAANSYIDPSYNWRLKNTGRATWFEHYDGGFYWNTAASSSAGSVVTPISIMKLGSNGNLLVGTTTDNGVDKLQVNGSISSGRVSIVTDLNEVKTDGLLVTGDFTFSLASNTPCSYGTLHQIARDSAECTQMVIDIVNGKLYTRVYLGTTWTAWVEK